MILEGILVIKIRWNTAGICCVTDDFQKNLISWSIILWCRFAETVRRFPFNPNKHMNLANRRCAPVVKRSRCFGLVWTSGELATIQRNQAGCWYDLPRRFGVIRGSNIFHISHVNNTNVFSLWQTHILRVYSILAYIWCFENVFAFLQHKPLREVGLVCYYCNKGGVSYQIN